MEADNSILRYQGIDAFTVYVSDTQFSALASPQSQTILAVGITSTLCFDEGNLCLVAPLDPQRANKSIVIALRGTVTLDTKVRNAEAAGAAALIILDTTGDPIGPDLDQLSGIVVACIPYNRCSAFLELVRSVNIADTQLSLFPSSNCFGMILSQNIEGLKHLSNDELMAKDEAGHNVFHYAAARDDANMEVLQHLLARGPDICKLIDHEDNVKRQSSLHIAANNGSVESLKNLLQSGARMFPRKADGRYPIHVAAIEGHLECILCLINADPSQLNVTTSDGSLAIKLAAAKGRVDCVRALVQNGCNGLPARDFANGLAKQYLDCVAVTELNRFLGGQDPAYCSMIVDGARSRLISDIGKYIDESSVDVKVTGGCTTLNEFMSRYTQLASKMDVSEFPSISFLWHGCRQDILDAIMLDGFKVSYSNMTFNVYGAGVYFATDAKLSSYFVTRDVKEGVSMPPNPLTGKYDLILAAVFTGTLGVREPLFGGDENARTKMKSDLKHPANRNPPLGCQSASGAYLKEVVVYENLLAIPLATVSFALKDGMEIPDPYHCDATSDRTYLTSFRDIPKGFGQFRNVDGTLTSFDSPPTEIVIDAKLVMNWTSQSVTSEVSTEELMDRIAELEQRVAVLEHENKVLRHLSQ